MTYEWLGLAGILLVQGSLLPKVISLYRMRRCGYFLTHEPRLFYWMLLAGLICYLVYSISIRDAVYIVSNLVGITQASVCLWLIRR